MIERIANRHGLVVARVAGESANALASILDLDSKLTQAPKSFMLAGHTFRRFNASHSTGYKSDVTNSLQFCIGIERVTVSNSVKARHFSTYLTIGPGEPLYRHVNDDFSVYGYVTKSKIETDGAGLDNFGYAVLDNVQAAELILNKLKNTIEAVSTIKDKDSLNGKRIVKRTKFKSLLDYVKAVRDALDGKKIVRYTFSVPSNKAAIFDQALNRLLQKHGVSVTR